MISKDVNEQVSFWKFFCKTFLKIENPEEKMKKAQIFEQTFKTLIETSVQKMKMEVRIFEMFNELEEKRK
jgi:hypothetical protein